MIAIRESFKVEVTFQVDGSGMFYARDMMGGHAECKEETAQMQRDEVSEFS